MRCSAWQGLLVAWGEAELPALSLSVRSGGVRGLRQCDPTENVRRRLYGEQRWWCVLWWLFCQEGKSEVSLTPYTVRHACFCSTCTSVTSVIHELQLRYTQIPKNFVRSTNVGEVSWCTSLLLCLLLLKDWGFVIVLHARVSILVRSS